MARPSKIHDTVTVPPVDGLGPERQMAITDAIVYYIGQGSYPTIAAQACGISESTLANWLAQGAEWEDADPADYPPERAPTIAAYVAFLGAATRAEAMGLMWHERNVRVSAAQARDRDGRLSLEFLARRKPKVYSKRVEIAAESGDRKPAHVDRRTADEVEASFLAAALPEGFEADDFLPSLGGE